jgi:hypothetical protein
MMHRPSFAPAPRTALIFGALLSLPTLYAAACANSDNIVINAGGAGGSGGGETVCILQNCQSSTDCAACSESRHLCNTRSHLCVACNTDTGEGCAKDEYCSKFGYCVPMGVSCPSDGHGVPMITCGVSADCSACDDAHRVCDTVTSTCVACTQTESGACQNGMCTVNNVCQAVCPASCTIDPDCAGCNIAGKPAFYCAAGNCVNMLGSPDGGSSSSSGAGGAGGGTNDGGPTGSCHPTCQVGPFMDPSCDACTAAVCAADSYCCMTAWDTVCVGEVGMHCGAACGCSHPECTVGDPLPDNCSPCATKICAADSFCCSVKWDLTCVGAVPGVCGVTC